MRVAILCNDRLAVPALDCLMQAGVAVAVGMPDRMHETQLLVKQLCRQRNVPFQLFGKKALDTTMLAWLQTHQPDVVLVKTFPFLVPASLLQLPRYGFINFHYAPLPEWRGRNPLFWMLRNGERTGGVTVHEMNEKFDEGPILLEEALQFDASINFGILVSQLSVLGMQMSFRLLNLLQAGALQKKEQDNVKAKWYDHPKPVDLFIDWQNMNGEEITALVRACNPWNKGAGTTWNGQVFGITYAAIGDAAGKKEKPGTILSIDPGAGFTIATKDGRAIVAEVVYREEGFYPGYCLSAFGLKPYDQLL